MRRPSLRKPGCWVQDSRARLNTRSSDSKCWAISTTFLKLKNWPWITAEHVWGGNDPSHNEANYCKKEEKERGKKPMPTGLLLCAGWFISALSPLNVMSFSHVIKIEINKDSVSSLKSHSFQVAKLNWQPVFLVLKHTILAHFTPHYNSQCLYAHGRF